MTNKNKAKRFLRVWHRRLGLVIGIQLLFWTLSGVYFAWFHIDNVHGDYERTFVEPPSLGDLAGVLPPAEFVGKSDLKEIKDIRFGDFLGRKVARLYHTRDEVELYDALTGERLSPVSREQAERLARADFKPGAPVESVALVTEKKGEYKGPVPAYRVSFGNSKNTNIYVHVNSGQVTARRNSVWRGFDFLWMLHILDFGEREDFNNILLRVLSLLGLLTVVSGYGLWLWGLRKNK